MHRIVGCPRNSKIALNFLIFVGRAFFEVMDQNSQNVVWINNSRTAWPTLTFMLFLSALDNLL